jgi:hypothetical protein
VKPTTCSIVSSLTPSGAGRALKLNAEPPRDNVKDLEREPLVV